MVTSVQSMPNEVNEMIYIASGCIPKRDQCQEGKIRIFKYTCFLNTVKIVLLFIYFLNVHLKLENIP